MDSTMIEITAAMQLLSEVLNQEEDCLKSPLDAIIEKFVITNNRTKLLRKFMRYDYEGILDISFEVGILNEEDVVESKIFFHYEGRNCRLEISSEGPSRFTKEDTCKIEYLKALNTVIDNICEIEQALYDLLESSVAKSYIAHEKEYFSYESQFLKLQQEETTITLANIEKSLSVGDKLTYKEGISSKYMLFNTNKNQWHISKVCDKTVKLTSDEGSVKQLNKGMIAKLIYDKTIIKEDTHE